MDSSFSERIYKTSLEICVPLRCFLSDFIYFKNHLLPPIAFKPELSGISVLLSHALLPVLPPISPCPAHSESSISLPPGLSSFPPLCNNGSPFLVLLGYKQQTKLCTFKE